MWMLVTWSRIRASAYKDTKQLREAIVNSSQLICMIYHLVVVCTHFFFVTNINHPFIAGGKFQHSHLWIIRMLSVSPDEPGNHYRPHVFRFCLLVNQLGHIADFPSITWPLCDSFVSTEATENNPTERRNSSTINNHPSSRVHRIWQILWDSVLGEWVRVRLEIE